MKKTKINYDTIIKLLIVFEKLLMIGLLLELVQLFN